MIAFVVLNLKKLEKMITLFKNISFTTGYNHEVLGLKIEITDRDIEVIKTHQQYIKQHKDILHIKCSMEGEVICFDDEIESDYKAEFDFRSDGEYFQVYNDCVYVYFQSKYTSEIQYESDRIGNEELNIFSENAWGLTDEEIATITNSETVEMGKWVFSEINGEYEAIMDGVYMHVFSSLKDLLARTNEMGYYEYSSALTEELGEETFADFNGNIRNN